MGCFNKIGFISSLPICSGDPTTLVFLKPNKYSDSKLGGVTYSTDWYEPIFPPIFGDYDDYGKIEDIEKTDSVKFIEDFFGLDIEKIIKEIDNNSVGRYGSDKMQAPKNNEIYKSLTFGLEHTDVFVKMAEIRNRAYENSYNHEYWLLKFGFNRIEDNSDPRFKQTWVNKSLPDYTFNSDGTWGNLQDKNGRKIDSIYHPDDLEREMLKINPNAVYNITDEDRSMCKVDLSITSTKLAILQRQSAKDEENEDEDENTRETRNYLKYLLGTKKYQGIPNITDYLTNMLLDGTPYSHGSRNVPELLLETVNEKEIGDMIRFNNCLANLNGKYQPSNYGSQDDDLSLHNKMNKCYRSIIRKKMEYYAEDGNDYYNDDLAEFQADDRDDVIDSIILEK